MKTKINKHWMTLSVAVFAAATLRAVADQSAAMPVTQAEHHYTGTVISVSPQDRMVRVKAGWFSTRTFNLGDNCNYAMLDTTNGTVANLRPGEKITVGYQTTQGVRVANYIVQEPLQIEGMVSVLDPQRHLLIIHRRGLDKQLQLPDGCKVVLRDSRSGSFNDLQPGNHVLVTYEIPDEMPTARQIAQTSRQFVGTLTAIDLSEKTVKAKALFDNKKFNVANNCAILTNGRTDGKLADLRPNEKLEFSYDQINGVNVVNRIAPAPTDAPQTNSTVTTSSPYPTYPAY